MKDLLREVDEIPVTTLVALAYGTLAVLTGMMGDEAVFAERIAQFGWLQPTLVASGLDESWRLLAHAFLHGNILHLMLNMASLWAIGPALERSLGSVRFALLYVVSALGGAFAVCWLREPMQPVLGGSGALFGMMGAAVALNVRAGRHAFAFLDFDGPRRLLGTIAINLVFGALVPIVSNTAHVGGLLAGFLVTLVWLRPPEPSAALRRWRLAIAALFAGLAFWAFVPSTRHDWLRAQADAAIEPARRAQLQRAALRADPRTARVWRPYDELEDVRPGDLPRGR